MVAKIESGKNLRGILHYNENKVSAGEAKLILASGFAGDINKMNFMQKLTRFKHLTELNAGVKTNALHISLNFDASDKIDNATLQQIASEYMERIGFGEQPFLVYRHEDAHHPHIHIMTTNIQKDGERIDIHGIGYKLSEPARKEMEIKYGLIKAEGRELKQSRGISPAVYAGKPTKQLISGIVGAVMRQYAYTSFTEYQTILKQFNIKADRGAEETQMYQNKGLQYSILDDNGKPIGIPIKASDIYCKPTIKELEKKYGKNELKRSAFKQSLKDRLYKVFKDGSPTKQQFKNELLNSGIDVVYRESEKGQLYGVTYIDHRNKAIFKGSDLGKAYSAKALETYFENAGRAQMTTTKQKQPTNQTYLKPITPTNFLQISQERTQLESGIKIPKRKKKKRRGRIIEQEQQITL